MKSDDEEVKHLIFATLRTELLMGNTFLQFKKYTILTWLRYLEALGERVELWKLEKNWAEMHW